MGTDPEAGGVPGRACELAAVSFDGCDIMLKIRGRGIDVTEFVNTLALVNTAGAGETAG